MSLEEDKKLIAEKLMGWTLITEDYFGSDRVEIVEKEIYMQGWNPQTDRNAWPEIWERMDEDFNQSYLCNILDYDENGCRDVWTIHTAPPEVCFKALIKTLKESK